MTSDQDKERLPVKHGHSHFQNSPDTVAQAVMGYLPGTESIDAEEKIELARNEGYDPLAIELALAPPASSTAEKVRLLLMIIAAAVLVIVFFPLNRFFKPEPKEMGSMSIGGPILEDSLTPAEIRNKPWLKILIEVDRLYFRQGKLSEALHLLCSRCILLIER